jgi:hypothetical protein
MAIPLVLLHIPALVSYVLSENAIKDAYARRQNACQVLEEFTRAVDVTDADRVDALVRAVEKCKGAVKCPTSYAAKTLASLHDALCKHTPDIRRPVEDVGDTCDLDAWNKERSFVRELFGMQLLVHGEIRHVTILELGVTGNSLAKCVRDFLGDATLTRAPLVLVCGFEHTKTAFVDYPYEFELPGPNQTRTKYTLCVVATPLKTMFIDASGPGWHELSGGNAEAKIVALNSIITKEARVIAYKRA